MTTRPDQKILCWMHGCNHIESQLHIVQCKKLKPYWNLVFNLIIITVLGEPYLSNPTHRHHIQLKSKDSLLPEPTCAFLRHAFGCFYDAFSQIE